MLVAQFVKTFHAVKRAAARIARVEELFDRIRKARDGANISVNQAADALGVRRTQIWRLEHEATTVSAYRLFELADLYHVDPRELLFGQSDGDDSDHHYERIGAVVTMVESVIQTLKVRPPPALVGDAVTEVLKQEHMQPAEVRTQPFDPSRYQGLVALIFQQQKRTK